jgi:hypothetical protein
MDRSEERESSGARRAESGYGDDQGTRVGAPDQERLEPAEHSDAPTGRPERTTGAGAEATAAIQETSKGLEEHDREHRSGYGGKGGQPASSSEGRE